MVLWDPDACTGRDHFNSEANKLIDYVRSTPRKSGVAEIRLPGDRSLQLASEREANGIPLDARVWQTLADLAGRLRVPVPPCPAINTESPGSRR